MRLAMAGCEAGDGYDHLFKVVLIGDTGVGKSSLLSRFTRNEFSLEIESTMGVSIATRHAYVDGKVIISKIWDLAGKEQYRIGNMKADYHDAVGAVIVYDVTSRPTFEKIETLLSELRDFAGSNIVVMLIGNKSDLSDSVTVSTEDGRSFAERKSVSFIETSAKKAVNVEKAFVELVTQIYHKVFIKNTAKDMFIQTTKTTRATYDANALVFRSSGKNEPAHFMLKIESYSLLSGAGLVYESDVFEAGGHKWRLDLYPNGNSKENGSDHISLYLVICDTEGLTKGWDVHVYIKFFVYDHIRHNYLTFLDADGNRTRFHEKMTKWGFDKIMPLDTFQDTGNGYLFNDSCVFGAEVFDVPKYAQKDQCLSMIKPLPAINTHAWTIYELSAITAESLYSDDFKVGKFKWKLKLYPKGNGSERNSYLSIYLSVHDPTSLPEGWRVYAKFKLRVKNQAGNADSERELENWYCHSADDWGFSSFMLLTELNDSTKGFVVNDTLIVEAQISIMGMLKNFI